MPSIAHKFEKCSNFQMLIMKRYSVLPNMQNTEFRSRGQNTRSFRQKKRLMYINDFNPKQLTERLHTIRVRVTSGLNFFYWGYSHWIANSCTTLFIWSFQQNFFLATPNIENKFWSSYETHESTISLNFEMYFLEFPYEIVFNVCYFMELFISLALRQMQKGQ